MSDEDEGEGEVFDPEITIIGFNAAKLREPSNLELAEYIDANNMMWFTAMKCLQIDRDMLHDQDELNNAVVEARAAQAVVLNWWRKMIVNEKEV